MPLDAGLVGALQIPIAAGTANQRIADTLLDGLLDFVAYTLNDALNARLAVHTGIKRGTTLCTAVPSGQSFAHDPTDPQAEKFRIDPPCLFMWWPEDSALSTVNEAGTVCNAMRVRTLRLLWLMPELPSTDQYKLRVGLFQAADAALHAASTKKRHRLYSYGGHPVGTPIAECLAPLGSVDWRYIGGRLSRWGLNDQDPSSADISPDCKRDWPCLVGVIRVWERIDATTLEDPGDVTGDLSFAIEGCSESFDVIPIMDRYLDAPDGSELEPGDVETE